MSTQVFSFRPIPFIGLANLLQRLVALIIVGGLVPLSLFDLLFLSPSLSIEPKLSGAAHTLSSIYHYHLLEGALLGLTLFCAASAIYLRNHFFLSLAAWVYCNLYLGFYFLGLDALRVPFTNWQSSSWLLQTISGCYFLLSFNVLKHLQQNQSNKPLFNLLAILALFVFFAAPALSTTYFYHLLLFVGPSCLLLSISIFIHALIVEKQPLSFWQILLLSALLCGATNFILLNAENSGHLSNNFSAFIFLILCNTALLFGLVDYIHHLSLQAKELNEGYQNTPFPILKLSHDGYILLANTAFDELCHKLHISLEQLENWNDAFPAQNWRHVASQSKTGKYTELQLADHTLYDNKKLFSLHASQTDDGYVVVLQDITPFMNTLERFKAMANNDPITQVLNQRGIEKALAYAINNLNQHQPCFLGFLSVNQVNYINRTYGHPAGDALLQEVSQRINGVLKGKHAFGRLGNDDFVFLLSKTTPEAAQHIAQQIVEVLNTTPVRAINRDHDLNISLGLIEIGEGTSPESALRAAQSASAEARYSNKAFVLYEHDSPEMQYRAEELQLFEHLESGMTQGLYLVMQPLLNLHSPLEHFNLEVLLRVRRANGEPISLQHFIPAAEENGTISIIDKWVVSATLEWANTHQDQLSHVAQININLSGHSLNNEKFVQELFVILDKYEKLLPKICMEITEGVALHNLKHTRDLMRSLQKKGVSIALDDFGAGYTSFSYLSQLPVNSIKIDGALIENMLSQRSQVAIVRTIIELAHNLGMSCVAEWVRDEDTLVVLRKMGVDYAQGFAIAAPLAPERVIAAKSIIDLMEQPDFIPLIQKTKPIKRAPPIAK